MCHEHPCLYARPLPLQLIGQVVNEVPIAWIKLPLIRLGLLRGLAGLVQIIEMQLALRHKCQRKDVVISANVALRDSAHLEPESVGVHQPGKQVCRVQAESQLRCTERVGMDFEDATRRVVIDVHREVRVLCFHEVHEDLGQRSIEVERSLGGPRVQDFV